MPAPPKPIITHPAPGSTWDLSVRLAWGAADPLPSVTAPVLAEPVLNPDGSVTLSVSDVGQDSTEYLRDGVVIATVPGAGSYTDFQPESPAPAPSALQAGQAVAGAGDGVVHLDATAATGGTGTISYQWHRASGGVKGAAIAGATSLDYDDSGRTNGQTYQYILTATDGAGASVDYDPVSATPYALPPSGTAAFEDDFESYADGAVPDRVTSGCGWASKSNDVQVVSGVAYSGTKSLRLRWPASPTGTNPPLTFIAGILPDVQEVWFRWMHLMPENYNHQADPGGGTTNNKFWEIYDVDRAHEDVSIYWENERLSATPGDSRMKVLLDVDNAVATTQYSPTQDNRDQIPTVTTSTPGTMRRGLWTEVKTHVACATSQAAADGVLEIWIGGVLVFYRYDLALAPSDPATMNHFFRNWRIGDAANAGYPEQTDWHIDEFKVYLSNPGW